MKSRRLRRSAGFSLVESAIVLGMVGIVMAGVWQVMVSARQSATSNALMQQVLMTTRNVRDYFSGRAMPTTGTEMSTTYTTAVLRAAGVFPEDMCPANCVSGSVTTIYNVYRGATTFALPDGNSDGLPDANQFSITLAAVDRRGCMELGMKLTARASETGLTSFKIGANAAITSFPISLTTVNTQCSGAAAGNTLVLIFRLRNS